MRSRDSQGSREVEAVEGVGREAASLSVHGEYRGHFHTPYTHSEGPRRNLGFGSELPLVGLSVPSFVLHIAHTLSSFEICLKIFWEHLCAACVRGRFRIESFFALS